MIGFVNLHQHTQYSTLDSINKVRPLFERAKALGQKALAITDHGNMGAFWEAYNASKATGVKYIPGNEIYFVPKDADRTKEKKTHLVLLAANHTGYKNLLKLTAIGFDKMVEVRFGAGDKKKEFPVVDEDDLRKHAEGIYCTSACSGSILAHNLWKGNKDSAYKYAELLLDIFQERFFIEIQPHNLERVTKSNGAIQSQKWMNDQLIQLAYDLKIPMVTTCDSHYLKMEDEKYHDMMLAIADKTSLSDFNRHRYASQKRCEACVGIGYSQDGSKCEECLGHGFTEHILCPEFYLKSEDEILQWFEENYDRAFGEYLVKNASYIADQCQPPTYMEPTIERLPVFSWKYIEQDPSVAEFKEWLEKNPKLAAKREDIAFAYFKSQIGLLSKIDKGIVPADKKKEYISKLKYELDILESKNFCSYMLIVSDYINWAKANGIDVGPGRGSGVSSLVGYCLNIHEVDPVANNLLFERFVNKQKTAFPDYDVDFASEGRDKVVNYVETKYGGNRYVVHVSNFNRMTPKVILKDIARSLQIGGSASAAFQIANKITAEIPNKVKLPNGKEMEISTLEQAYEYSPKLSAFMTDYPEIEEYAKNLVGIIRAASTHAGGVIISDIPLDEYVPLRKDKTGAWAMHGDKNTAEAVKLVKMDFLGLKTLDILRNAYNMAKAAGIDIPEPQDIPDGDLETYKMLQDGDTLGVFQLEGDTIAPLVGAFKPKSIYDIAIINALGRPALSDEQREDYINRRFRRSKITYPHPLLEDILKHTCGIPLFDEDLLRIGQAIAGWDLSEADGLRKLTKLKEKGADLAAKLEKKFIEDAVNRNGLDSKEVKKLWEEVVVPYAKYAFNLAHAVAYSVLSYRTAYYKKHIPEYFLCAKLNLKEDSASADSDDSVLTIRDSIKTAGIKILPCDINYSTDKYFVKSKYEIVTGLVSVKGVGNCDSLLSKRPFMSFGDLFIRGDPNKTQITALSKVGAFDNLGLSRKFIVDNVDNFDKIVSQIKKDIKEANKKKSKSLDLFAPTTINPLQGLDHEDEKTIIDLFDQRTKNLFVTSGKPEYTPKERILAEKEVFGQFISGGIEDIYPDFFNMHPLMELYKVKDLDNLPSGSVVNMEGVISNIKPITIKSGNNSGKKMAFATFEDLDGQKVDITIWNRTYEEIEKAQLTEFAVIAKFKVSEYNGQNKVSIEVISKRKKG